MLSTVGAAIAIAAGVGAIAMGAMTGAAANGVSTLGNMPMAASCRASKYASSAAFRLAICAGVNVANCSGDKFCT